MARWLLVFRHLHYCSHLSPFFTLWPTNASDPDFHFVFVHELGTLISIFIINKCQLRVMKEWALQDQFVVNVINHHDCLYICEATYANIDVFAGSIKSPHLP